MDMTEKSGRRIDLGRQRDAFRAHVREAILVAAASILREDGPAALTLRRVAQAVGASTKVIYTAFGGRDGLFDALYIRSFAGLQQAMEAAAVLEHARDRLDAVCNAYRDYALAEPGFYNVMYGDLGRAWQAPPASIEKASRTFRVLREAVAAVRPSADHAAIIQTTRQLWAAMHGLVSLQMQGMLSDQADFELLFYNMIQKIGDAEE
jgi:AcrR family transcriptional regulator